MRILFLGAGATGGYFGARLAEAGADVSFLVRQSRLEHIKQNGLIVKSKFGDIELPAPSAISKAESSFDLIVLSCKAYDLDSAMELITPAVGVGSAIIPLLNGMAHVEKLKSKFGSDKLLGGLCIISSTIDESRVIRHLNDVHTLKFGEFSGEMSERVRQISEIFELANFSSIASEHIKQDMWEKWIMIASLAALTTLMRANLGEIARAPEGVNIANQILQECFSILRANADTRSSFEESTLARMVDPSSTLAASMLRDLEAGFRVEADQILGDLIARAEAKNISTPLLRVAYCNLKVYELKRNSSVN